MNDARVKMYEPREIDRLNKSTLAAAATRDEWKWNANRTRPFVAVDDLILRDFGGRGHRGSSVLYSESRTRFIRLYVRSIINFIALSISCFKVSKRNMYVKQSCLAIGIIRQIRF